jgi:hypothetical protein
MPKPSESYNLYVLRPDLAREWHPTRNGTLGPRNVTPGSGRKVWWLCEQGHWWLASVRDRVKGLRCTYCRQVRKASPRLLVDEKPELLMEWHPSKNTDVKAREVNCTYEEKLWWLCPNGHEWQATVRTRLSGKPCPVCCGLGQAPFARPGREKDPTPAPSANPAGRPVRTPLNQLIEQESPPRPGAEHRKSKRYAVVSTVMIESSQAAIFGYGQMSNYSASGMFIRSDFPIRPGTLIRIRLEKPLYVSDSTLVNSRVVWCKPSEDDAEGGPRFGIGVRLV